MSDQEGREIPVGEAPDEGNRGETTPEGEVRGQLNVSDSIVERIARMAAQEVPGVHALGTGLKDLIKDKRARGVEAAVGAQDVAISLEITVLYGYNVRDVANQVRAKVAEAVMAMTGRRTLEVNIHVVGIHFPEVKKEPEETKRVK